MINAFEFQALKTAQLPKSWQASGVLDELERFLQRSWEQRGIFYFDRETGSRQQFIDFDRKDGFKTQNYIGTISFRGEQLNIFPKIYREDEDDADAGALTIQELIDDLVAWLGYCDKFNFPFVSMKEELTGAQTFLELLITVYVHYVRAAINRQPFFRYEEVSETGNSPRGKIDFKDYAARKYPSGQWGTLQYTYSGFIFDNLLNRIIKCTCKMLEPVTVQPGTRRILHDILLRLGAVRMVSCTPYDCDHVHLNALQSNYALILSMSKMFLLNKVSSNDLGAADTFCFLFPAELLFEGFIGGFIREAFSDRVNVSTQTKDLYLTELVVDGAVIGNRFLLKEDILLQTDDALVVLDTKYKEIDQLGKILDGGGSRLGISDADMKQMAVYANRRGASRLYLLYPLYRGHMPDPTEVVFNILDGEGASAKKIPLQILQVPFSFGEDPEKTKALLYDILVKTVSARN